MAVGRVVAAATDSVWCDVLRATHERAHPLDRGCHASSRTASRGGYGRCAAPLVIGLVAIIAARMTKDEIAHPLDTVEDGPELSGSSAGALAATAA